MGRVGRRHSTQPVLHAAALHDGHDAGAAAARGGGGAGGRGKGAACKYQGIWVGGGRLSKQRTEAGIELEMLLLQQGHRFIMGHSPARLRAHFALRLDSLPPAAHPPEQSKRPFTSSPQLQAGRACGGGTSCCRQGWPKGEPAAPMKKFSPANAWEKGELTLHWPWLYTTRPVPEVLPLIVTPGLAAPTTTEPVPEVERDTLWVTPTAAGRWPGTTGQLMGLQESVWQLG